MQDTFEIRVLCRTDFGKMVFPNGPAVASSITPSLSEHHCHGYHCRSPEKPKALLCLFIDVY